MESFAKAPEPVSVEPMLRLLALGTQLTKSLLPCFSPYTSSIEKQDRRHRKTRHRKLIESPTSTNRAIDSRCLELLIIASERASAHRNTGMAACHLRSPVRSECQPFNCCVTKAATYGKAASRVTFRSLCPERRFRIVGSQKAMP